MNYFNNIVLLLSKFNNFAAQAKTALRKLLTILLLLLVFISQVGYYFFYSAERAMVQSEMKASLLNSLPDEAYKLVVLEDNAASISWEEKGNEFYLNGKLYDVARIKNMNGKTYLYCLDDQKEEKLVRNLAKAVKSGNENPGNNKSGDHTVKFQVSDYITNSFAHIEFISPATHTDHYDLAVAICTSFKEVKGLPPRA